MKKSLIALAVFGAFSGAALADGSSVQLYGLIDMGITHTDGIATGNVKGATSTTSSTALSSGAESGSRIGLKGTEDLGGGLNVIFDAETGFCATGTSQGQAVGGTSTGSYCTGGPNGGFMQRQSWVGLTGNFGKIMAGRMYTNPFNNEANFDPFGYGLSGNIANIDSLAPARSQQTLVYITPDLSGFVGNIAYVFSGTGTGTIPTATPDTSNVPRAISADGEYKNGPVDVGASYTRTSNAVNNPTTTVNDGNVSLWQAFGAYDFGVAKVSALYEHESGDYTTPTSKFYLLGLTVPVGPGAILASYDHVDSGMAGGVAKQYAIGYTYSLSKQTNLYASYAHINNGTDTAFTVGDSTDSYNGVAGQNSSGMAIGLRHSF